VVEVEWATVAGDETGSGSIDTQRAWCRIDQDFFRDLLSGKRMRNAISRSSYQKRSLTQSSERSVASGHRQQAIAVSSDPAAVGLSERRRRPSPAVCLVAEPGVPAPLLASLFL
jgi:hypothetical protein